MEEIMSRPMQKRPSPWWFMASATLAAALIPALASGQPAPAGSGPTVADSSVGYIDSAIPGTQVRLRYDASFDNPTPNLAEFFWSRSDQRRPESGVDYQDFSAYLEYAFSERFSGFVELPWRFLDPEVNSNTNGLADMNAGFKYAFVHCEDLVATFQLRGYFPTGDADRGLGNDHVSLEPALLLYAYLTECWHFEGEFRYWIPIDGDEDFAGDVIRYGAGLHYDLIQTECWRIMPVVEVVGWTVLDGQSSSLDTSTGLVEVEEADGDTIVNAKVGVRTQFDDVGDVYAGYGVPLTGDVWYENTFRLEFRLFF
jgi:hypothetical protein